MDTADWLRRLGFEQYAQAFVAAAIDGDVLLELTDEDLRELGVSALGHRKKVLSEIAALRARRGGAKTRPSRPASPDPSAERRQAAVLFADLVGYTALSRELDAEELHALLDLFFERVDPIIETHGGHLNKHIGDCVMGVFGAPIAYGNDAVRAVHAALEIRDAVAALGVEAGRSLQVHIGVAAGQVLASATGSTSHSEYTVTGESVNLASRLADAAAPGEILVSDAVARAAGGKLNCADAALLSAKGFAEPVRAWQVLRFRTETSAVHGPLVGRQAELRTLEAALTACRASGRGQALYLRGEAGIGKTRLVEEFQRIARDAGFACHTSLVLDFGSGAGCDAIGALTRSLLDLDLTSQPSARTAALEAACAQDLVDPEDIVFLNDLLDLTQPPDLRALSDAMDNESRRAGKIRATSRLVERLSGQRPRLLVIEDLHWADQTALDHLSGLAGVVAQCPAILAMTSRIEGDPLNADWRQACAGTPLVTIDLGPLRTEDARWLASGLLAANAAFAERCIERAAGNPLFLEQLLSHAQESLDSAAVPGSVQSLVQARFDRVDAADKAALQAASVLGQRFDREALLHLVRSPHYQLDRLVECRLLRHQGGAILFAHALIRDAIYETLLRARRRELHLMAADWFAQGRDPVLHAEHLDRAEDPGAALAYLAAAQTELTSYRYETALGLVEGGLAIAGVEDERFALAHAKGEILEHLGRVRDAAAAYAAALAAAGGEQDRCRAWIGLAGIKRTTDDLDGAFADLDQAETVAVQLGLTAERARIHFLRGNLYFPRGDVDGCNREHHRALELAREAGSVELEAMALGGLGDARFISARMLSAYERFENCISLAERHGLRRIAVANRPMAAIARYYSGDTTGALEDARTAIAEAAKVGHQRAEMIARGAAVLCLRETEELAEAFGHADAVLNLAKSLGAKRFEAQALSYRANLHRISGRRSEALSDIHQAIAIGRKAGMAFAGPRLLGVLAVATADPDVRCEVLKEAEGLLAKGAAALNQLEFRCAAIEACIGGSDWGAAERHAQLLEDYTRAEPLPWAERVIARGRALAAEGRRSGPER